MAGERPFEALALMALRALTMPISNAVVERAFSVMSCIKCRKRNRMQLRMLEALMRVRIHLKVINQCRCALADLAVIVFYHTNLNSLLGRWTLLQELRAYSGYDSPLHLRHV